MQNMMDFALWFLRELPSFLLSEPICYFVGLFFGCFIVTLIRSMCRIR